MNHLSRNGCLVPGRNSTVQWVEDGQPVATLTILAEADCIGLLYPRREGDAEGQHRLETVRIVRTACRFSGTRPYFVCPGVRDGVACERRVAKLYAAGGSFLCRHCHGLVYESDGDDELDRAIRRANKIRANLGSPPTRTPGFGMPFPERPKGMWQSTYEGLRAIGREADNKANWEFKKRALRIIPQLRKPVRKTPLPTQMVRSHAVGSEPDLQPDSNVIGPQWIAAGNGNL